MGWLAVLGLTSVFLIAAGVWLAAARIRAYNVVREARKARAFADMAQIAEKKNVERRMQNLEESVRLEDGAAGRTGENRTS